MGTVHKLPNAEVALDLMRMVGARVRALRTHHRLSRKALSAASGVSQRYLAQLEAGDGNISIARLLAVATALETPLDRLLRPDDGLPDGVRAALTRSDPDLRNDVLKRLGLSEQNKDKAARICLIGLRGAGKSTLGAYAAKALGLPFVELNTEIAEHAGMATPEVIELYGQDGYRRIEAEVLDQVIARQDRVLVAAAGGIVANPETYARLKARFHTIWIKAAPEEHMSRVRGQGDTRLGDGPPEAMEQLRAILSARAPLYAQADQQLDTSGQPLQTSCDALAHSILRLGVAKNDKDPAS